MAKRTFTKYPSNYVQATKASSGDAQSLAKVLWDAWNTWRYQKLESAGVDSTLDGKWMIATSNKFEDKMTAMIGKCAELGVKIIEKELEFVKKQSK